MANALNSPVTMRPLPTLERWLDQHGGGERAADYDQMVALRELAERTILQSDAGLPVAAGVLSAPLARHVHRHGRAL